MAIFHMTARIVSRSGGESAVSTAAYCAGDRLRDFETGRTIDKTKKTEVVFSEILLCKHAPAEFADREKLWNAVEKRESHKNAQLARIFEIALPREIDQKTQIEMVREYILSNFVAGNTPATSGMIADWSLHDTFGSSEYAKEELRAEIGALFTESDLQVPLQGEHVEDHSDYLRSWISALQEDYNEFFRACTDAEKISGYLMANYTAGESAVSITGTPFSF